MASVACVLYHHIGIETKFEAGLNVTTQLELFTAQMEWLNKNYDVIDLECLLGNKLPRKPLLITFDDYYSSAFEVARKVLHPMGLPSVFFVNPGLLGPNAISLDSVLAWCVNRAGLHEVCAEMDVPVTDSVSSLIGSIVPKLGAAERSELKSRLQQLFGPVVLADRSPTLDEGDIAEFHKFGIEIGNHTQSHVYCRTLDANEQLREIVASKSQLETLSGRRVRSFAVPYGNERDLTPEILQTLRTSGHEAVFLVHARSNRFRPEKDVWYRVNLNNELPSSLSLKLKTLPMLRSLKKLMSELVRPIF